MVLAVLAALLVPSAALSADTDTLGVLAVAPPPGPGPELVEMTSQFRLVLSERSPGVLDAAALRDRMAGPSRGASLGELDKAYEGALAAYLNGDYEGSVRTLRAVIEDLEKLPDDKETFRQWTRATMRLASTELDLGRRDVAREAADRLVRADPNVQVDAMQFPPELVRLIETARSELRSLPTRVLTVNSSASGVRVFVNGREVGTAPVTATLARGHYRVSGARGTVRAPPLQVDLSDENQSVTLDFTIVEALRPTLGPGLALSDAERARRLVAVGGFLRLDSILATSLLDEAGASYLLGSLYDVRRGMLMREGRLRLTDRALTKEGAARLASGRALPVDRGRDPAPGAGPDARPLEGARLDGLRRRHRRGGLGRRLHLADGGHEQRLQLRAGPHHLDRGPPGQRRPLPVVHQQRRLGAHAGGDRRGGRRRVRRGDAHPRLPRLQADRRGRALPLLTAGRRRAVTAAW